MTKLAVVIVTYNRLELLKKSIKSLEQQTLKPDSVIIVNNASTDGVTKPYLDNYEGNLSLEVIHSSSNTGGAGGFHQGIKYAYEQGFDWIYVMDDDVVADKNCLAELIKISQPCMLAVREDKQGIIVERAAFTYDFNSVFRLNPKGKMVCEAYQRRQDMPATLTVNSSAFEGFMLNREVIDKIGFPEAKYFILYDDLDYVLRAVAAGYSITAVRDAILVRQLPFNPQDSVDSWKAFYAFRNLFHIHYKFGENWSVKNRPYVLAVGAMLVYGLKYRKKKVLKDIFDALQCYKSLSDRT